ncbi:MAG: HlyD family secretion protein [Parcubacteria group bacterium Gr01-1014_46]|nr:MAG: HlyD family secretion protein [Parcubacteria group bacterium Gr01-1014_46]
MKTYIQKIKNYILSHKKTSVLILLVLAFISYKTFSPSNNKVDLFTVKKSDIVQKVIVNGNTKPVHAVKLGFDVNGRVSRVYVDVGSRVTVGQQLVTLDSSELYASSLKAEANLASEEAKLDEVKKGTRPEEIAVSETEVLNAQIALNDAQNSLKDKVVDSITNSVDQLFSNPRTSSPQLNLQVIDSQLKSDINNQRAKIESIILSWQNEKIEENFPIINKFVDAIAIVVNAQTPSSGLSQTTIDGYKASISTAKSALVTSKDAVNSAKSALALAQQNLNLKKSGSTPEAIKAQEAKVLQMKAEVQSINAQLSKLTLRSPQNGVVTVQDVKVGEIVTSGKTIISIISDSDLEIESNVSEVSIGKVSVGNPVVITFDAFPGETFLGKISYVEPGETIVDGVVNYKVTVAFNEKYPQIKSGLTSRLEIITGEKKDVLTIPEYAVLRNDSGTFVSKQNGKVSTQIPVTIGLRGQDGFLEVISGLNAGDIIETVAPVK